MKKQPPVSRKGTFCRGRRVKGTESAQQKQIKKTELQYKHKTGRTNAYSGSGMQAVFLGGSGPRIGPPGTGVFLPRDPSELRNKSGIVIFILSHYFVFYLNSFTTKIKK